MSSERTVLISSRMDELGSSRRAAFRAVHDEGWIPLLYEIESAEWLAAERRTPNREEQTLQKSYIQSGNERLTMTHLLETADHFIGIYGTSLGDPSAQFNGLRPLEYEFLRFLMTHQDPKNAPSVTAILRPAASPDGFHAGRGELQSALARICDKSRDYHKVFCERMALFLKEHPSDVPASSLMYSTIHRLYRAVSRGPVNFFESGITELPTGVVYWRPSSQLYLKIRLQIQQWKENKRLPRISRQQGSEFGLKIRTRPEIGFVFNIVKAIFSEGYTVRVLRLRGRPSRNRVMYMTVAPYLHLGKDEELITRLRKYCAVERADKNSAGFQPLPSPDHGWLLDILVADRPGMLARALAPLAYSNMRVLTMQVGVERTGTRVRRPQNRILATFEKARKDQRKGEVIDKGLQLPKDPQFALDLIAADLTSQPGFYSVRLSRVQTKSHRRKAPNGDQRTA